MIVVAWLRSKLMVFCVRRLVEAIKMCGYYNSWMLHERT
jgi:hypothetical protein